MSYVGLNMSAIAEALKIYYLPGLRYQLNDKASALLAQIDKNSENVSGKEIRMALRYGRVGGIGNRADDGELPTPAARQTIQAVWDTKNIFARFRLTDKTIAASKDNVGAFANMLETEISDCETDARLDLSRQVIGDASAKLATMSAQATVASPQNIDVDSTMYLAEGMLVDFLAPTTGIVGNNDHKAVKVISVTSATRFTANVAGATIVNGSFVVPAGNTYQVGTSLHASYELTGVQKVVGTGGTLYGINRTTHPWLNGIVDAVDGQISEVGIQKNIDNVEVGSGSETNFLITSKGVARAYQNLQTAMKQHVNTLDLKGGWSAMSYTGGQKELPIVSDKYVPEGLLFGLDLNDWIMAQMGDWDWLDKDGAMLSRVPDRAAWEATLVKYCDMACQRPRGQFVMTGITEL